MLNFESNLGVYEHNLLAYKRDIRGANFHPGVNLPPGANCAHEHGFRNKCSNLFSDLFRFFFVS